MSKKNDEIKEEIKIEGVNEIPENADIVDEVEIETPDEVSEEVVQAVAQGIVEEAEEQGKTVKTVVNEILDEAGFEPKNNPKTEFKPEYNGDLRGFKTFEEMVNYPNTDEFKKLDIGCQAEYKDWLKNNVL